MCTETMSLYVSSENQSVTENMFGHVLITEMSLHTDSVSRSQFSLMDVCNQVSLMTI